MSDKDEKDFAGERGPSGLFLATLGIAFLASIAALVWSYTLQSRLATAETKLVVSQQENGRLADELAATNARLKATSETLGDSVGMTQKQLEARAQEILHRQQVETARLERQQKATQQQIGSVSQQVTSVQSDVGGVKTDVATTKSDLADTKNQLQRVMGDAGVMSGLIARNHDELEVLKHQGDRNYYEFTLHKNAKPTMISTISLQLKKADTKHSRYTLIVNADDKKIEKKDRSLDEPVQFYTGKGPVLYELVVNQINKNEVVGYLSTPKSAPQPASAQ